MRRFIRGLGWCWKRTGLKVSEWSREPSLGGLDNSGFGVYVAEVITQRAKTRFGCVYKEAINFSFAWSLSEWILE